MSTTKQPVVSAMNDPRMTGAVQLAQVCSGLKQGEKVYILANPETEDVARYVLQAASGLTDQCRMEVIPGAAMHGASSPQSVAQAMFEADVIFCLTLMSMAHSAARKAATDKGARYLSLPDYSLEQLSSPALLFDFASLGTMVDGLGGKLDQGQEIHVTTASGSDLHIGIGGRLANRCPGLVLKPGELGSPPDAEVNIAPIETLSQGKLVIDGSIPCKEVGLLKESVELTVENGCISQILSKDHRVRDALEALFERAGDKSRVLAEFGIGLNPEAELCGRMLEDEGCAGTVHFGFGSNITIGGRNDVAFHLDFVMRAPKVTVDGLILDIPV